MAKKATPKPDEPVEIDLSKPPPEPERPVSTDYGVKAEEVKPEVKEPAEPDLADQVARLKAAEQAARDRAAQAETARQQVEQARAVEAQRSQQQTAQAQFDSVVNALAAAQHEANVVQNELANATAVNDAGAIAEAVRRLSRVEARIATLEDGKGEFERHFEQQRQQPQYQQPQQAPSAEQVIAQIPGLMAEEKDWLRAHPETLYDNDKAQRLQVVTRIANDKGLQRGSPDYLEFVEDMLGYRKGAQVEEKRSEPVRYSAPVSRSGGGPTRASDSKVTLTPQQREAAKISGIDEFTYAKNLQKLRQMKDEGHYQ